MPSLAKPFAVFGAAAGLFAILGVGAFREPARDVAPLAPMIVTAGAAAAFGEVLGRWRRLHDPKLAREALVLWVAILSGLAGGVSGAVVGVVTWGADGLARFAVGGAVVALAFVPSCLVVFDAARRAGRARLGSLVAATDRRTVTSTVLAGVSFAGASQVPAVLSANTSSSLPPLVQVGLSLAACLGSTIAIVLLQKRDRVTRAELEAHAGEMHWLERAPEGEVEVASQTAEPIDLGLGADRWARTSDATYRSSARSDVVLKGSMERAVAAFDECAQRRHRSLVIAVAGLTAVCVSFALRLSVFL
ncbi:MAG TPA: hypothetical protein VH054_15070 [Polyangiaceae bacterium]|nr:hypothetical protein [Polyangiaceae bacterium]